MSKASSDPKDTSAWNKKGLENYNQKRYKVAIDCFTEALKLDPKNANAWNNKAQTFMELKIFEEALKSMEEALKLNENDAIFLNNKGKILLKLQKPLEALSYFESALSSDPKNIQALNAKGIALNDLKRYNEALKCFNDVIKIDKQNAYSWRHKGISLNGLRQYAEAILCFENALEMDASYANAWVGKGICFRDQKKLKEAIECFENAWKLNDESNMDLTITERGHTLMLMGNLKEALDCFADALKMNRKNGDALILKALTLIKLNEFEKAKSILAEINSQNLIKPEVSLIKGLLLSKEDRFDEAIECFDNALAHDAEFIQALIAKGDSYNKRDKYEEAIECFNKALKINGHSIEACFGKAFSYKKTNRIAEALFYYSEVIKIDFNNKEAYLNTALIFRQNNNFLKAVENLNELIEIDPKDASMFELRGDIFSELEDSESASKDYEAALNLDRHNDRLISKSLLVKDIISRQSSNPIFDLQNKISFEQILTEQVRLEIDNNNINNNLNALIDFSSYFDTHLFNNERIANYENSINNDFYLIKEMQKSIHRFNKLKYEISFFNKKEITEFQDEKNFETVLEEMKMLDLEATRMNMTISGNQTIENRIGLNKNSLNLKEKVGEIEKILNTLVRRYNNVNNKINIIEDRIHNIENELKTCLKNYEDVILNKLQGKVKNEDLNKINDYIYGFTITLSNVFVGSQAIETNLMSIYNTKTPISLISFGISLIPVLGYSLKCGINSVWEFINERVVRKNAGKILMISKDGPQFSQKIGGLLEELFDNESIRNSIIQADDCKVNEKTDSSFDKIKKFCSSFAKNVQEKIYSELHTTATKKLGFIHANLIIENIYSDKLEINADFNIKVIEIIRKDLEKNYEKDVRKITESLITENPIRATSENKPVLKKKKNSGCVGCTIY